MIRMADYKDKLTESDLVGKYVLVNLSLLWSAFGRPRIVTNVDKSKVFVDEIRGEWNEEEKIWFFTEDAIRKPDGHIMARSIKCICDTVSEVNTVLETNAKTEREYIAWLKSANDRLNALDGVVVAERNMPPGVLR